MATEREKERESELESAMYTNCLLLGLDPSLLGPTPSSPRVGLFRHSNPKLGEQLLYFLLSALRGPAQSAKDFDKVWPIFDSAQSRDFRKIVQGIISELESQGALPRSNSRVSSLATCCGPRFVELLWQLSVHALREVHKRTFAADVASNPLPASLTDVSYLHAASLLPVTKARIALERRKFLKNAALAVQRQNAWSNLAQEMTAEFRGLCAEEAYLQQELEKLQEMRNKAKLEGELWDDRISSTTGQSSHLVSKATRLWESILARKGQHEVLASGPIEDLIAHREHRYRISGSSLQAAMNQSSNSGRVVETSPLTESPEHSEITSKTDDRGGGGGQPVDVAEILRRWTHALQRIHKQSLHLAKANDGEGPELLRSSSDSGSSGHAESLATTLAEHRQHLVSIQGLISQLKETIPAMQKSISELTEEANSVSSTAMDEFTSTSNATVQSHIAGRHQEAVPDEAAELTSRLSSVQLEKVPGSPALKLPPLFSVTPNSTGKSTRTPRRPAMSTQSNQESLHVGKSLAQQLQNDEKDALAPETDVYNAQNIRRSVREAVMSRPSGNSEPTQNRSNSDESEHFFIPLPSTISYKATDVPNRRKQRLVFSPPDIHVVRNAKNLSSKGADDFISYPVMPNNFSSVEGNAEHARLHQPASANGESVFPGIDDTLDQMLSPQFGIDPFFEDSYEDLLAPLSETDTALMDL